MTFTQRGEDFDLLATQRLDAGDYLGFEQASLSAKSMRMLAVADGEMTEEQAQEVNEREYPVDRGRPRRRVDA